MAQKEPIKPILAGKLKNHSKFFTIRNILTLIYQKFLRFDRYNLRKILKSQVRFDSKNFSDLLTKQA